MMATPKESAELTPEQLRQHTEQCRYYARGSARSELPITARLTNLLTEDPVLLDLYILADSQEGQAGCTLVCNAVSYLLIEQPEAPLARVHPLLTGRLVDPEVIAPPFREFCLANVDALRELVVGRTMQFNTPRRGIYVLPMVAHVARSLDGAPLSIIEIGCSVGLNLLFDQWSYDFGSYGRIDNPRSELRVACEVEDGSASLPLELPNIRRRVGIDLHLFDLDDPDERRWLKANMFADLPQDPPMLDQALAVRERVGLDLIEANALAVLDEVIDSTSGEICLLNSFCLNQWSDDAKQKLEAMLLNQSRNRDLHRVSIETSSMVASAVLPGEREGRRAFDMIHIQYHDGEASEHVLGCADNYARWLTWYG